MNENIGVAPPNYDSDVGQMRAAMNDTEWTELDPPQVGFGSYKYFSDAELEAFLNLAGGSIARALSIAFMSLVTTARSGLVRADDLQINYGKNDIDRWLALALYWGGMADGEGADFADVIFPDDGGFIPEGSPPVWGRAYTWKRWR